MITTEAHEAAYRRFDRTMRRHTRKARSRGGMMDEERVFAKIRRNVPGCHNHDLFTRIGAAESMVERGDITRHDRFMWRLVVAAMRTLAAGLAVADAASKARECGLCGRDPDAIERVTHDGYSFRLSGHACHCVREGGQRIAIGICCGHMVGIDGLRMEHTTRAVYGRHATT